MAKLTLTDLTQLSSNETSAVSQINANMALIEAAIELLLSRDGASPNTMEADLDLNSNNLLNGSNLQGNTLTLGSTTVTEAALLSGTGATGSVGFLTTSSPSAATSLEVDLTTAPFSLAAGEQLILVFNDLTITTDDDYILIRCSTDNGVSFDAGTDYMYQHLSSSATSIVANGNTATSAMYPISPSASEGLGNAANESLSGTFTFYNLVDTRYARMDGTANYTFANGNLATALATSTHKSTSAVTNLEISVPAGTFSGTIYWYKRKLS